MSKGKFGDIIDYWQELEFLSPFKIKKEKNDIDLLKEFVSWEEIHSKKNQIGYIVYLGKIKINYLLEKLQNANPSLDDSIEEFEGDCCVCALQVDIDGKYKEYSFSISSFVWAICQFINQGINTDLNKSNFENLKKDFDKKIRNKGEVFTQELLNNLLQNILEKLGIATKLEDNNKSFILDPFILARPFFDDEKVNVMLSSFYLNDMDLIRKKPTNTIKNYVLSVLNENKSRRIQIDKDIIQMQNALSIDKFPRGMWPAKFSPSLMQQIAINLAISDKQPIFSVNGPPGTGKTTLLKEVVAEYTVKCAERMAKFSKPDNAFKGKVNFESPTDCCKKFYKINNKLSSYGILVVSNNNKAVENISEELPKIVENNRTGHFSKNDNQNETYFSDIATNLLKKDAWGLISAKLGNKANITAFVNNFWSFNKNDDEPTLDKYFNSEIPDWKIAVKNFNNTLYKVKTKRKIIAQDKNRSYNKEKYDKNFADEIFWDNLEENIRDEKLQTTCPWTYSDYDKAREELFYQAMMLRKAFVLNSRCVKNNLLCFVNLWNLDKDKKLKLFDKDYNNGAYAHLLRTLMLVIPVISTTLASVQKFLKGVSLKQIGLLVIDESGQANPQSALGAIWRAKKSVIVGDPLQIEPVDTVPEVFKKIISRKYNVGQEYKNGTLSVQVLADKLNKYGGYNGNLWLGCPLVVHRRCTSPMFDISNKVAYEGRMINQTPLPKDKNFFVDKNAWWYDCKGTEKGNKDHTVEIQIKIATKLLKKAIENCKTLDTLDIFFITPFVSVKNSLKSEFEDLLRKKFSDNEAKNWTKSHCGTIHTFQGKEANEVVIVLGCDKNTGKAAAEWIGSGPNIINVAVSRAKYRLAIIGDYDLFKEIKYMNVACEELKDKIVDGQVFLDNENDTSSFMKNHAKLLQDLQKLNDKQLSIVENIVFEFVGVQNKRNDKNTDIEQKQSAKTTAIESDKTLCPICGKEVREGEKGFYCSDCKFPSIWKEDWSFNTEFTREDIKTLCQGGQTSVKNCKNKEGKEYKASFVLDKENDYKLKPIYN